MKNKKTEKGETLREKLADSFDAAKEIILDVPKIVFVGNRDLTVENYKSIAEYTDREIVLEAKPHKLKFRGSNLEIKSIAREMIYIAGNIMAMEFLKEE